MDMYKEHQQYVKLYSSAPAVRAKVVKAAPRSDSSVTGIFTAITFILLIVMVYQVMSGSTKVFTFTNLLENLRNAPTIDMSFTKSFQVSDAVASIPILGGALKFLTGLASVASWITLGIIQVILYIGWVFSVLFVV